MCEHQIAFTPDDLWILSDGVTVLERGYVDFTVLNAESGDPQALVTPNGRDWIFALDPTGRLAVYSRVGLDRCDLQWYSFEDNCWLDEWENVSMGIGHQLAFSPDGRYLAIAGFSTLTVWAVLQRQRIEQWRIPDAPYNAGGLVAFSPDGAHLVFGEGRQLRVFHELKPVCDLSSGLPYFTSIAFHPSGNCFAATKGDVIVIYDTATWTEVKTIAWEIVRMRSVAFSPDGLLAAAGSDTGKVVVWDVDV
jgi:hypothetical protein